MDNPKIMAQIPVEGARRPARMRKKFSSQAVIEEAPSGEAALLASVLALAICDASQPEHAAEARRWLLSDSGEPGSFRWYCRLLSLDPVYILRVAFGPTT